MVHPLTMACHAMAMGLAENDVIAACLVKCLDRVNNMAGMADAFSRKWMVRYTEETDRYYPAILDAVKKVPEWNNAWWLLRYQLTTMTEAFKRLL